MAIDTETKRASTLNVASHHPGHWFGPSEPDAGDLDDANQRGFILWHYAGIAAAAPAAGRVGSLVGRGGLVGFDGPIVRRGGMVA